MISEWLIPLNTHPKKQLTKPQQRLKPIQCCSYFPFFCVFFLQSLFNRSINSSGSQAWGDTRARDGSLPPRLDYWAHSGEVSCISTLGLLHSFSLQKGRLESQNGGWGPDGVCVFPLRPSSPCNSRSLVFLRGLILLNQPCGNARAVSTARAGTAAGARCAWTKVLFECCGQARCQTPFHT